MPEPLPTVDRVLRRAATETDSTDVRALARWIGQNAPSAAAVAVQRTLEELLTNGLLERRTIVVELGGSAPGGFAGPRQSTQLARTETCERALDDAPLPIVQTIDKFTAGKSDRTRVWSEQTAGPLIAQAWCTAYAVGTHQHAHAQHHGSGGFDGSGHSAGHHGHHGHHG